MKIYILVLFFMYACAPHCAPLDPNARTVVTSQYDGGPEYLVRPEPGCKPQLDCSGKTEGQCAVALYEDSKKYIDEGQRMMDKKFYLSASAEYMQAMSRLVEAEIRIRNAKTDNYEDWKLAMVGGLEKNIKKRINFCRIQIKRVQWLRGQ
jgi:hypothetical protein